MFSFWEQESFIGKPDFIVLGSGIVGLNAAWEFKRLNPVARVVVCERGMIPFGASTGNAGFACFGSVSELLDDLDNGHSEAEVFGLVEKRWKGLLRLRKKLGDKNIGLENRGGYEIFTDKDSFERCMDNTGYLNHHLQDLFGTEDIYAESKRKNFGFKGIKGMIINKKEGQIHTGKMMKTLIAKVQKIGVEM
jgi:glycine/D-amino acid oxidase-like deaminating enzyme